MSVKVPQYDFFNWDAYCQLDSNNSAILSSEIPPSIEVTGNLTSAINAYNSYYFNKPLKIGLLTNHQLPSMNNFNAPVHIVNGRDNCARMFYQCYNFNQPVTIPDSVTNCDVMFYYCNNFNQPVTIPDGVTNCANMFNSCRNFNQPITIPNGVTDCSGMFYGCNNFNISTIKIPNNVTNCFSMYEGCFNTGTSVIHTSIIHTSANAENLTRLIAVTNKSLKVYLSSNKLNGFKTFSAYNGIAQGSQNSITIYVNNTCLGSNFSGMMNGTNKNCKHIIYCNNLRWVNGTTAGADNCVWGAAISWASTTNGYYNATLNIYLYNNYTG